MKWAIEYSRDADHFIAEGRMERLLSNYGGYEMESHGISKTELKELMKEALISVLTERKDLLEDALSEAIGKRIHWRI